LSFPVILSKITEQGKSKKLKGTHKEKEKWFVKPAA
jgi:hypothetical protein